jgi:opacity protein-like surface antigen
MSSVKNKVMILALVVLSSGLASGAETAAPQQSATVKLGVAIPMIGDLKDIADTGLTFGAQAMHRVSPQDRYGIDLSYITFGKDSQDQVDTEVSIISTMAMMHHEFAGKSSALPFIETGFGFARTQVNIAASNAGGAAVTRGTNQEDISPTLSLGVGVDMPISNDAAFGVSLNYQHFFFKVGDVDGGGSLSILAHLRV